MKIIIKIFNLLSKKEKNQTIVIIFMTLIMGIFDALGVASILPFISILSEPNLLSTNQFLKFIYSKSELIGIKNQSDFLFFLGFAVFLFLLISLSFKALTTYMINRFVFMREYSLGKRLLQSYLCRPYVWFLNKNSSDLGKTILSEVSIVIRQGLTPLMNLIAQGAISSAIILLLLIFNTKVTIIIFTSLFCAYSLTYIFVSGWLKRLGKERLQSNSDRFKTISEAFGAIKNIKIKNLENIYEKSFSKPAFIFAKGQSTLRAISQIPRYIFEIFAFGGLILLILYLMQTNGSFLISLPMISLYAFAGYRLIPSLQQIYSSITQIRFCGPAIESLNKDLIKFKKTNSLSFENTKFELKKSIKLEKISFSYPGSSNFALNNIDLNIKQNSSVGIVGATGSGKTTLIDLILGLLTQTKGKLLIDDIEITSVNKKNWQEIIGYVPQNVYLIDDSIISNIALGIEKNSIDFDAIVKSAKIANLHDFIINELDEKYQTIVGERGVRLSGGQVQRIGIARALYHNPEVLVFDEATSSLDNITEKAVMDSLNCLVEKKTILIIAHRLSTVQNCDQIIFLDKGQIKATGTYSDLCLKNLDFRNLVGKQ